MSILELARTTPVNPPTVNRNTNPAAHKSEGEKINWVPWRVPSQLKILIPVGTAIIMVAAVSDPLGR